MNGSSPSRWQRLGITLLINTITALLYWAIGLAAGSYFAQNGFFPAPMWLPAAVALAAALQYGRLSAAGIFAGSLALNHLTLNAPLGVALGISLGNTGGVLLGAQLLETPVATRLPFYQSQDTWRFLGALALASGLAALSGSVALSTWQNPDFEQLGTLFFSWWMSDATAQLILTPALLFALAGPASSPPPPSQPLQLEAAVVVALTLGFALQVFFVLDNDSGRLGSLPFVLLMPLLWAAARLPLGYAYTLSCLVALMGIISAVEGHGIFFDGNHQQALFNTELLIVSQNIILLMQSAIISERQQAECQLSALNQSLEQQVCERTAELSRSEASFRQLADAAPFPLLVVTINNQCVQYANQRARQLLLPDSNEPPDLNSLGIELQHCMVQCQAEPPEQPALEVLLRNNHGKSFWAKLTCSRIEQYGQQQLLLGLQDISEHKRLEQGLQAANAALRQQVNHNQQLQRDLREQTLRDPLTNLFNRRYLDEVMVRVLAHMGEQGRPVSVLMIDLDWFKTINDRYGHPVGDEVLLGVAQLLQEHCRAEDIVCRYGGEEFLLLLPGAPLQVAHDKGEQLRQRVASARFASSAGELPLTLSIGVACSTQHGRDRDTLLGAADTALYTAKNSGRNQICIADGSGWDIHI